MKSLRWIASYIIVASLGLWGAFTVTAKIMAPAQAQEAPPSGDLPAEFLKEIEATQVPEPTGTSPGAAPPAEAPAASIGAAPAETVDQPPIPTQVEPEQALQDVQQPQAVGQDATNGYIYDPTGKRDPFKPHKSALKTIIRDTGTQAAPDVDDPLLKYELDKWELVGILWDVKVPKAVVRDPEGNIFNIVKNTKIGRSDGFVATIRDGEIVVIETVYDEGKTTREPRVLELKK